jgi:hypothetical protein
VNSFTSWPLRTVLVTIGCLATLALMGEILPSKGCGIGPAAAIGQEAPRDQAGIRQVQAAVKLVGDDYQVRVRFLAVGCFDKATNREMNLEMGRSLALEALGRQLSDKPKLELVVSGARTVDSRLEGKFFSLTVQIPRDGVKVIETAAASETAKGETNENGVLRTSIDKGARSRKAEYEVMVAQLSQLLRNEWKRLRAEAGPDEAAAEKIEAFRKKVNTSFDQLAGEIQGDLELTNLGSDLDPESKGEKDQLLALLNGRRELLLKSLDLKP